MHTFETPSLGCLSFDPSGQYLTIGMDKVVKMYNAKTFEQFSTFEVHNSLITGMKWGEKASCLATVGLDRHLSIFE